MNDKDYKDPFSGLSSVASSAKALYDQALSAAERFSVLDKTSGLSHVMNSARAINDNIFGSAEQQKIWEKISEINSAITLQQAYKDQYSKMSDRKGLFGILHGHHSASSFEKFNNDKIFDLFYRKEIAEKFETFSSLTSTLKMHKENLDGLNDIFKAYPQLSLKESYDAGSLKLASSLIDKQQISSLMKQVHVTPVFLEAIQKITVSSATNLEVLPNETASNNVVSQSFLDYINTLPEKVKIYVVLIFIVLIKFSYEVAWDLSINLASSYLQPIIKELISSKPHTSNNEIKKLSNILNIDSFEHMRFVTGDKINVRNSFSQKSKIIDELYRGDVVTITSKDASLNWSNIRYINDDGVLIEGWVNSRYLKKLNPK